MLLLHLLLLSFGTLLSIAQNEIHNCYCCYLALCCASPGNAAATASILTGHAGQRAFALQLAPESMHMLRALFLLCCICIKQCWSQCTHTTWQKLIARLITSVAQLSAAAADLRVENLLCMIRCCLYSCCCCLTVPCCMLTPKELASGC